MFKEGTEKDTSSVLTGNNTFNSQNWISPFRDKIVQPCIQMYKGLIDIPVD